MEQLRKLLTWLKQHHFWVLSVVVVLVALGCWYTSSGALGKQFKEHQGEIQKWFTTEKQIRSEPFHPNDGISEKQLEENKKLLDAVAAVWQKLYERQRANALKWPPELSQEFRDTVEKLKFGDDIETRLRNHYHNYINRHYPKLPETIQARIIEGGVNERVAVPDRREFFSGRGGAGLPEMMDEGYVCDWPSQQLVRQELEFISTPSPLKIWVTQENLWAYQTLLDVIAATNQARGADRPSNAAVQVLELLQVGQTAAQESRTSGRIALDAAAVAPPAAPADGEGRISSDVRPAVAEEGGREGGGLTLEQEQIQLLSGRYVDDRGKPIPFSGDASTYKTAFGREYKRLPVRMVIKMDIRSLSYLLTQCANQPLQIEVQEVRFNPRDAGAGASFGERGMAQFELGQATRLGSGDVEPFPLHPNIMRVVIQGLIYIFNEPNPGALQPGDAPALGGP